MGDEDGGGDVETGNSEGGFFMKCDSKCEFTQIDK
jgi:hypothetical protein